MDKITLTIAAQVLDFVDFMKSIIPAEEHEDGTWSLLGFKERFSSLDELTKFVIRDAAAFEEAGGFEEGDLADWLGRELLSAQS
jgi:hypothetical protein